MLSVVPLSVVALMPTTVPPSLANISNSSPYDSNFGPRMSFLIMRIMVCSFLMMFALMVR